MGTVRISATVRFFGASFESNLGMIGGVTKGGIGSASFGRLENPPTTLWSATTAALASDVEPEFSAFNTHSEVASIAVNALVEFSRMTEVTVKMRSSIEKEGPVKVAREYLANFKRFVEQMLMPCIRARGG